ncbi:MAG: hypothetical protein QM493_10270 [Sulfurovum sp.]
MSKYIASFEKLKDTDIAGKPSTRKSLVMKFMYAIDETITNILNDNYQLNDALLDMFIVDKRREKANESEVMNIIGNIEVKLSEEYTTTKV